MPPSSRPDRAAGAGHRRVDAERPVAFPALWKVGGDQRQGGRRDHRAADALHCPRGEQPRLAVSEPAKQGRPGEQQQPEDEHPPPAEDVTGTAAEQEQPAEGDRVGVHHPLQAAAGEAECLLDVREGNVDDGRVEHDHELGGGDDHQRQAEAACCRGARPRRSGAWSGRSGALPALEVGDVTVPPLNLGARTRRPCELSRRAQACRQPCERPSPDPGDRAPLTACALAW